MLLTGNEIFSQGIIINGSRERIRDASYDLGIERMIHQGEEIASELLKIAPHETVILISEETVKIPNGYMGHALPKTGLSNKGILALSTGIVDPGYEGKISSTMVNFSKEAVELEKHEDR